MCARVCEYVCVRVREGEGEGEGERERERERENGWKNVNVIMRQTPWRGMIAMSGFNSHGQIPSVERQRIRDPRVEAVSFVSDGFVRIRHGGLKGERKSGRISREERLPTELSTKSIGRRWKAPRHPLTFRRRAFQVGCPSSLTPMRPWR